MCIDLTNLFRPRAELTSAELRNAARAAMALGMVHAYEGLTRQATRTLARERRVQIARIERRISAARERIHSAITKETR